jgi:hypothetical protein
MSSAPETPLKKPYQKPSLRVYGDIQTLSGSTGAGLKSDGHAIKTA